MTIIDPHSIQKPRQAGPFIEGLTADDRVWNDRTSNFRQRPVDIAYTRIELTTPLRTRFATGWKVRRGWIDADSRRQASIPICHRDAISSA
jgi:hypothetical protein